MDTRIQCRTEAIVLRILNYGESDRIVTFCTAEFGKIRGIAKGARSSRKRFANALEPFSLSRIYFSPRGADSLVLIEGCDVLSHFSGIRANLEKTLAASYLIDLIDQFTREDTKSMASFCLLHDFLGFLNETAMSESLLRFFEIRLLRISGYDPVLDRCIRCMTPIGNHSAYGFDASKGGLICQTCGHANSDRIPVSLGTIRSLIMGREMPVDRLGRLALSNRSANESRVILSHFIRHILGRELKSARVMNEIQRLKI